ncbi:MAG: hypothetical protein IT559_03290 [Alphaproteobacteria bacterium]|nr:hypothetical protein [Alphaproteobacteria bacterium]
MVFYSHRAVFAFFALLLVMFFTSGAVLAQSDSQAQRFFEEKGVRAADAATLIVGKTKVGLWGVESLTGMSAQFQVLSRLTLDSALGAERVRCEIKARVAERIKAQCTNSSDLDLGLFMLQQGMVTADRSVVYGTVFEGPYLQAEMQAQNQKLGLWADTGAGQNAQGSGSGNLMITLGFILFLCIVGAFSFLSIAMIRGFKTVAEAQKQSMDMAERERALKDKERALFAMMLDSEIKANKSKIQAYLAVYDEMLKALKDTDRPAKYKKAGDIVQSQPAFERSVFDRNTEKMDILGDRLSSQVIHFYARIKTNPDYINIEPDMPLDEVIAIVEKALKNAERLDKISDRLIDLFSQGGLSSQTF